MSIHLLDRTLLSLRSVRNGRPYCFIGAKAQSNKQENDTTVSRVIIRLYTADYLWYNKTINMGQFAPDLPYGPEGERLLWQSAARNIR